MVVLNQRPTSSKFNYETILFIKEMNSTRMTRRKTITFMFYLYKCTMCFFFFVNLLTQICTKPFLLLIMLEMTHNHELKMVHEQQIIKGKKFVRVGLKQNLKVKGKLKIFKLLDI